MKKNTVKYIIVCVLTCLIVSVPFSLMANVSDLRLTNIRKMAMGNAGVAISNDETALYNNPAGLMNVKGLNIKAPRLRGGFNSSFVDRISELSDMSESSGDDNEALQNLKTLVPMQMVFEFGSDPLLSVVMEGLGFGLFSGGQIISSLKDKITPTLKAEGAVDVVPAVGYATGVEILGNECAVGISAKYISRSAMYDKISGDEVYTLNQADLLKQINDKPDKKGTPDFFNLGGFGLDLGLLTSIDFLGKGNFGIAVHNLGAALTGTKRIVDGNDVEIENRDVTNTLPVTCVLGLGVESNLPDYLLGEFVGDFTMAADYKIVSPYDSFFKNLHMGIEKKLMGGLVTLRGGLNQGIIVGGLGLDLVVLHLDYAYFAEELGEEIGVDQIDYHVVQLGVLF
ncbi:hypothetical protein ACFLZV_01005 [Candidatus Margulisiibacteriota bacterium]